MPCSLPQACWIGSRAGGPTSRPSSGFRNHWYPTLFSSEIEEGKPTDVQAARREPAAQPRRRQGLLHPQPLPASRREVLLAAGVLSPRARSPAGTTAGPIAGRTARSSASSPIPKAAQIGKQRIRTFPSQEAKGIVFVFVGDSAPPPLAPTCRRTFSTTTWRSSASCASCKSNWRLGVENGFDAGHIWIHKKSMLVHRQRHGAAASASHRPKGRDTRAWSRTTAGRRASTTCSANARCRCSRATSNGEPVARRALRIENVADNISIWLPGVLKVDPWPQEGHDPVRVVHAGGRRHALTTSRRSAGA